MRTSKQIIAECNSLASMFYQMRGRIERPRFKFYEATHPEEVECWEFACYAYDHIEGTDVQDIVDNLEQT